MRRRIVAWQLSLFDWPPRPGYAWRRSFWTFFLGGEPLPYPDAAARQRAMLTCESEALQ